MSMSTGTLTKLASSYSKQTGLKLATISTYAANDGKFFKSLSEGAGCTLRKADRIIQWFDGNWPADLEWPQDIPRPSLNKTERKPS